MVYIPTGVVLITGQGEYEPPLNACISIIYWASLRALLLIQLLFPKQKTGRGSRMDGSEKSFTVDNHIKQHHICCLIAQNVPSASFLRSGVGDSFDHLDLTIWKFFGPRVTKERQGGPVSEEIS